MAKTQRHFQIVQTLRSRKRVTAQQLADQLEVSVRTVYRDMQQLLLSGVPINGEAGSGYWLEAGFDFPPLMFTEEELEALVIGMRLTQQCTDKHLREAATTLLAKVEHSLPKRLVDVLNSSKLDVPVSLLDKNVENAITLLRRSISRKQRVEFAYRDEQGRSSERRVRPLELSFWGKVWTLTAWCELRDDFRNFRLDRIDALELTGQYFLEESGKSLEAYYQVLQAQGYCKE